MLILILKSYGLLTRFQNLQTQGVEHIKNICKISYSNDKQYILQKTDDTDLNFVFNIEYNSKQRITYPQINYPYYSFVYDLSKNNIAQYLLTKKIADLYEVIDKNIHFYLPKTIISSNVTKNIPSE